MARWPPVTPLRSGKHLELLPLHRCGRPPLQRPGCLQEPICLAHLAREVDYAHEAGTVPLPLRLKLWLERAFALARDIAVLAPSTRRAKQRALKRNIDAIVATPTQCSFARARYQLLTFCAFPGRVEPTNN